MNRADFKFFVYILKCSDGSYYVGHTKDLEQRVKEHDEGRGAKWTAKRPPVELVYQESFECLEAAIRREQQLKKWTRAKKEALIAGDLEKLKQLGKSNS